MAQPSFLQFVLNKACAKRIPVSGTLELTARCNLSCKMCYIHKKEHDPIALSKELPTEFWLDFIEQAKQNGTLTMLITGGEPLLRKDFREIYLACKKAGFVTSVNTNGTLLTEADVEFFKQYPPARLNISLYGASFETYRALCGIGQLYERVTNNVRALCAAGVAVKLNYTVTAFNFGDAPAIYAFARELSIPVQHSTYMFPALRASENGTCSACRATPEQAAEYMFRCDKEKFSKEIFSLRAKGYAHGCDVPYDEDEDSMRSESERIFCRAGVSSYWLTYDGRLLPCGMMEKPFIDLQETTFAEAWQSLKEETEKIYLPSKCTACKKRPYCEVCAAVCYGESLRYDAVPEYMCRKTDAFLKRMKEFYEEEAHEA